MDGCRKAPIMTIGINPNLTAFAPGKTGASWCYPSFSSGSGADSWAKYAYYYRYRSVYQEHCDLKFVEQFLLPEGQVRAAKPGVVIAFPRASDDPAYDLRVHYDGEANPTSIHLPGKLGEPRYVVLVDGGKRFPKGELLAARLEIPGGQKTQVFAQPISYYMQVMPVLQQFEAFLRQQGHADVGLRVGEDVGQLDMVACASPHWGPEWLGGSSQAVNTIVANCVQKNAWALKQLIQTRPAILFLVGQASWLMFRQSFGHLIHSHVPLPTLPEDGPYTLLRRTTRQEHLLKFSTKIGEEEYAISTRLVIAPHFSYDENFTPQFRMSAPGFDAFAKKYPAVAKFLQGDLRLNFLKKPGNFVVAGIKKDVAGVLADLKQQNSGAALELAQCFYDPHHMMAAVLEQLYRAGELSYTAAKSGTPGFLMRASGPCRFCVNEHWTFPKGCPYGKPDEKQYSVGFLEKVATAMIESHGQAPG
jgi:hypothetical protein